MNGRNSQQQPKEAAEMNLTEEWVELPQALLHLKNGKQTFLPPVAFRAIRKPEDLHPAKTKQAREQLVACLATCKIRHSGVAAIVRRDAQGAVVEVASFLGPYSLPPALWDIDRIDFYHAHIDLPDIPKDIRQDLEAGQGHQSISFRLRDIVVRLEDLFEIKGRGQSEGLKLKSGAPIQKDWDCFWSEVVRHVREEGFPLDDNDWKKLNKQLYEIFPGIDDSLIRRKMSALRGSLQD